MRKFYSDWPIVAWSITGTIFVFVVLITLGVVITSGL